MNCAKEKPIAERNSLRMRPCRGPGCGATFFVCIRCGRGPRYCSNACRKAARHRQTRAVTSRYQRSEAGKLVHRSRQKAYRERLSGHHVTYQDTTSVITPPPGRSIIPPTCSLCGHQTVWVNPFAPLPYRLRRLSKAHRKRKAASKRQFSTFSRDR
jgi:hypothetical protein